MADVVTWLCAHEASHHGPRLPFLQLLRWASVAVVRGGGHFLLPVLFMFTAISGAAAFAGEKQPLECRARCCCT
jgi:hypothetical protein